MHMASEKPRQDLAWYNEQENRDFEYLPSLTIKGQRFVKWVYVYALELTIPATLNSAVDLLSYVLSVTKVKLTGFHFLDQKGFKV